MATIFSDERGQVVRATDVYGDYFYLADSLGYPTNGVWMTEEEAMEAFEALEDDCDTPGDIEIDEHGYRIVDCAYCGCRVRAGEGSPPEADDDGAWEEAAVGHDEDCEWVATRAHRREMA